MKFVQVLCVIISILFPFLHYDIVASRSLHDNAQFCTVETKCGRIRGRQNQTLFDKKLFYSFRGIPYAKPPIGNLRFKAPQKIDPWDNTLDAFDFGNDCVQPDLERQIYVGSEDCLFLNVFVPIECSAMNLTTKLPVMMFILGGKFAFGSSRVFGPDFMIDTNVIVVTFNYRPGPFGFLNLNLPEYSGNMAMKDQLLVLRWINENIDKFGGDTTNITLFGHSSGGASVNLHIISSQSNNLFQKAIMMSGSALNSFLPAPHDHSSILYDLAENLRYPAANKQDLIEFLHQIDAKLLSKKTFQDDYIAGFGRKAVNRIWTVSVEDENANEPFLTKSPFDILTNQSYQSNIDALYSSSPWEFVLTVEKKHPELLKNFDNLFEIGLPLEMAHVDFNSQTYLKISKKIRDFYFDGKHVDANTQDRMDTLMTDIKFLYAIDLSARIQATKSKGYTFFSKFSVKNDWNFSERKAKLDNLTAYTAHSDQLYYVFRYFGSPDVVPDVDYQNFSENSLQRQIIKNITNFYANFAKFRNPVAGSEPIQFIQPGSIQLNYYDITNNGIDVKTNPIRDRMVFWDDIFDDNKQQWNTSFNFHLV